MAALKTKTTQAIEDRMAQVPPGSYRYEVLAAALDFKNAWVELGAHLVKVRDGALYKEWGFDDFEGYCERELRIKRATAHKLTATYGFMERREPRLVDTASRDPAVRSQLPPFDVVQVLSRAEERGQIGDREYGEVRDRIFESEPPSPASLTRLLNQSWPPPPKPDLPEEVQIQRLARAARKLATDAQRVQTLPSELKRRAGALADDLEMMVPS